MVGFVFVVFGSQLMHCFTTLAFPPFLLLLVLCFAELGVHLFGVFFFFGLLVLGADIFFWFLDFSLEFSDLFVVVALELLGSSFVVVQLLSAGEQVAKLLWVLGLVLVV